MRALQSLCNSHIYEKGGEKVCLQAFSGIARSMLMMTIPDMWKFRRFFFSQMFKIHSLRRHQRLWFRRWDVSGI